MAVPENREETSVARRLPRQRTARLRVLRKPAPVEARDDLAPADEEPGGATAVADENPSADEAADKPAPAADVVDAEAPVADVDAEAPVADVDAEAPAVDVDAEARIAGMVDFEPPVSDVADAEPTVADTKPPAGRRLRLLIPVLAVALVGALVAAGFAGWDWHQRRQLDAAHEAAVAAARQATVNFVSISAASVDRDLQRITDGATGDFADEFKRGLTQARTAVVENNAESHGTVLRAGLVSGDLDSAVVIVAVDATVKNKGAPQGHMLHYRIQADMVLDPESGKWLVSRLQFVG